MPVSEAFARALSASRAGFNARVVEARHRHPSLDTAAFAAFLGAAVDPLVNAAARVAPDRAAAVTDVAYDAALELVGQGLVGAGDRGALVEVVWRELLPLCAPLLAQQPLEVIGALTNAALYLSRLSGVRGGEWRQEMQRLAPALDTVPHLRGIGQVVAWRAGAAHFREGALQAAEGLPEAAALAAMGVAGDALTWADVRARLRDDPWWSPDARRVAAARKGVEVGAFTGFGGTFAEPPSVRAGAQGFVVGSGGRFSLLHADVYGAVLQASTSEAYAAAAAAPAQGGPRIAGSTLRFAQEAIALDLPPEGLALVCDAHTVAVTSPFTHAIRLFPRR